MDKCRTIIRSEFLRVLRVVVVDLDNAEPVNSFNTFEAVAVEEDVDDLTHGCLVRDQQTLVLGLGHEDGVVNSNKTSFPHLQGESAITPRITRLQLCRSGVIVEN